MPSATLRVANVGRPPPLPSTELGLGLGFALSGAREPRGAIWL
jgi:hypothetical protein